MKNRPAFSLFAALALTVLVAGPAFAQVPTQPCKPRIEVKKVPKTAYADRQELQKLLATTFCEMRDELFTRGMTKFRGDEGYDILRFLDGREKMTFIWRKELTYGWRENIVWMTGHRGSIFTGKNRAILVGSITFHTGPVTYSEDGVLYEEVPMDNLKRNLLRILLWLTTLGINPDNEHHSKLQDYYYPLQRKEVVANER